MESWPNGFFSVSFSGGRTSGAMLIELINRFGPLPPKGFITFQNTSKEHDATYEFILRVEEHIGHKVHWLEFEQSKPRKPIFREVDFQSAKRDGSVFLNAQEFGEGGWLFSHRRRNCSKKMKRETMERFLKSKGAKSWTNVVGIRSDEARRARQIDDPRVFKAYPLCDWGWTREDVQSFWSSMPFDLELPYDKELGRNIFGNCTGCFLKSERDLALLCKMRPDDFAWWESLEEEYGSTFKPGYSYRDVRMKVESGAIDLGIEGYFCQAEDGECTGDE